MKLQSSLCLPQIQPSFQLCVHWSMPSSVCPGTDQPTVMSSCFWPLPIVISPKPYTQIHVAKLIIAPSDSPPSDIQSSPVSFPPIFPTIISMDLHISRIILLNYSLGNIHISCLSVSAHTPSSVWNAFSVLPGAISIHHMFRDVNHQIYMKVYL